jgi:hypothetical protein
MTTPHSRTWQNQSVSFMNFFTNWKRGTYDLDPPHQRKVVHNNKWKGDIIKSAIQFNDIPLVRFHKREQSDLTHKWESLDGKQRCSAIIEFLDNKYEIEFEWDGWPTCKTFYKNLSPIQRQRIDELNLDTKLLPETFSEEEISQYFQWAQNTKTTSLGEYLNSTLHSQLCQRLRPIIDNKLSEHLKIFKPIGTVDRYQHLEIMARLLYAVCCFRDSVEKFTTEQKMMKSWWVSGFMSEQDEIFFTRSVTILLNLLNTIEFKYKSKNNTYLPVFWYLLKNIIDADGNITEKRKQFQQFQLLLNSGDIEFKPMGGAEARDPFGAGLARYRYLCEKMQTT